MKITATCILIGSVLLAGLANSPAFAQNARPDREPPRRGDQPRETPAWAQFDAEQLRKRLIERQEELRAAEQEIAAAITELDNGAEPRTVASALMRSQAWMPREWRSAESNAEDGPDARQPDRRRSGRRAVEGEPPTEADRAEILAFSKVHLPELARRLERRGASNDIRMWTHIHGRVNKLMDLMEKDPPLAQLEIEQMRLAVQVSRAARAYKEAQTSSDETAASEARRVLTDSLTAQFDNRTAIMQHEITMLSNRISDIRRKLEPLQERRSAIVEDKADLLLLKKSDDPN